RFANDTMSATYLAAVKDRLYCDAKDSARRRQTQTAIYQMTQGFAKLLAPVLAHTADEAWRALYPGDDQACVHLQSFEAISAAIAAEQWPAAMEARSAGLLALEQTRESGQLDNPLDAQVTLANAGDALGAFEHDDLADLLGVSRVVLGDAVSVQSLANDPRCERSWKRDPSVRERTWEGDKVMLCDRDAEAVGAL
ncbi:MAG: class I tRNA ligase family protein, partial [Planctomycetota bacterium]